MALDLGSEEPIAMNDDAAEWLARFCPPERFAGHIVVERKGFPVWAKSGELLPGDMRCFYDADYRDVLEPDDPRIETPAPESKEVE